MAAPVSIRARNSARVSPTLSRKSSSSRVLPGAAVAIISAIRSPSASIAAACASSRREISPITPSAMTPVAASVAAATVAVIVAVIAASVLVRSGRASVSAASRVPVAASPVSIAVSIAASRPSSALPGAAPAVSRATSVGVAGADHRLQRRGRRLEAIGEPALHRRRLRPEQQERRLEVGGVAGEDVGRAHPDGIGTERGLQRGLERPAPALGGGFREGSSEVARLGAKRVVEGADPPDRAGDEAAERAQGLRLGGEPAGVADHLVADQPGGDQVVERGRRGVGGVVVHGEVLSEAQGGASARVRRNR